MIGARARLVAGAVLSAAILIAWGPGAGVYALAVTFAVAGLAAVPARRDWQALALITAEMALVTLAMLYGNPFHAVVPKAMLFHSPGLLVLLVLMAVNAATVQPLRAWWAGASAALCWSVAAWVTWHDVLTIKSGDINDEDYDTLVAFLGAVTQPRFFSIDIFWWQLSILAGCGAILGVVAWRAQTLAKAAAARQAAVAGLSAHFAPAVAEALASGTAGSETKRLAVLDCDLVGFSRIAAAMAPEAVASGLRTYHAFVEEIVFAHGGAVLKYAGDGVIAVFGFTGDPGAAQAAVVSAERLIAEWSAAQAFGPGEQPALVAGVDVGEVTAGIVGEGRALSLVVTGPAVDRAAALQSLRGGEAPLRLSDAIRAAKS